MGDGGWTLHTTNGCKAVEKEFGDKVDAKTFVEKVPESADAERVFRDPSVAATRVIFGTTFGYAGANAGKSPATTRA